MLTVYNCIAYEHNLWLVGLAAVVCAAASLNAFNLLHHVRTSDGSARYFWLAASSISIGFGIWATHFIAMLAYSPGVTSGYNIALTLLSLIAAILITGVGSTVALSGSSIGLASLGGAIVGCGIATMHYLGMSALEFGSRIDWNSELVIASILLGAVFGALAMSIGLRDASMQSMTKGAMLLTIAICAHHFTAMGAASLIPGSAIEASKLTIPASWVAMLVMAISWFVMLISFGGVSISRHNLDLNRQLAGK